MKLCKVMVTLLYCSKLIGRIEISICCDGSCGGILDGLFRLFCDEDLPIFIPLNSLNAGFALFTPTSCSRSCCTFPLVLSLRMAQNTFHHSARIPVAAPDEPRMSFTEEISRNISGSGSIFESDLMDSRDNSVTVAW